jgi:hypothetical protein
MQSRQSDSDQEKLVQALRDEAHDPAYRFVLAYGIPYIPAAMPDDVTPGERGSCFSNAFRLARDRPDLRYVEGYATVREAASWLYRHAWCVDLDNHVVDPTPGWGTTALPRALRGVVLPLEIAEPFATERSRGTLDEGMHDHIDLLAQLLGFEPV